MTQIIFQAIVACCCIYTAYRLSLFIFRRLFKGRKRGKDVRDVSGETADMTKTDNRDDDTSEITFEILKDISASRSPESGFYKSIYLVKLSCWKSDTSLYQQGKSLPYQAFSGSYRS